MAAAESALPVARISDAAVVEGAAIERRSNRVLDIADCPVEAARRSNATARIATGVAVLDADTALSRALILADTGDPTVELLNDFDSVLM